MIDFIKDNYAEIGAAASAFIAFATVVVKLTPTPKDDAALAKLVKVLSYFSLKGGS
jgi:hypothetical protein